MKKFTFNIQLSGYGQTKEQAWQDVWDRAHDFDIGNTPWLEEAPSDSETTVEEIGDEE